MIKFVEKKSMTDSVSNWNKKFLLKKLMHARGLYFDVVSRTIRDSHVYLNSIDNLDVIVYLDELEHAKNVLFNRKPCVYYERKFLFFKKKIENYPADCDSFMYKPKIFYEYGDTGQWFVSQVSDAVLFPEARWIYFDDYINISAVCFDIIV